MHFQWDHAKRQRNITKHGIDFLDATLLFDGRPVLYVPLTHSDEERFATLGRLNNFTIFVVWTPRGQDIRLISARVARRGERQLFERLFPNESDRAA